MFVCCKIALLKDHALHSTTEAKIRIQNTNITMDMKVVPLMRIF